MNISEQYLTIVKQINHTGNQHSDHIMEEGMLFQYVIEHLSDFMLVLDNCDKVELDYLYNQYPGFYRMIGILGTIQEAIAVGIETGALPIPKDH